MGKCRLCKKESILISQRLGFCVDCIRERFEEARDGLLALHSRLRERDGLPPRVPSAEGGKRCRICSNRCSIPEGGRGFCGVHENKGHRIRPVTGSPKKAYVQWYYDPLPTNCCASWVCPGGSDKGYPCFSYSKGPEYGYYNLAVFYCACNFDCLFCQNWSYRRCQKPPYVHETEELFEAALSPRVSCVCFFGGDPTPQVVHALICARKMVRDSGKKILRICWETNGAVSKPFLLKMAELSLKTGGCIKVDLKCFSEELSYALCGVSNTDVKENFKFLSEYSKKRPDPPLLVASTLLVPGYVDEKEIERLSQFISSIDPEIPWVLLAFHPDFHLLDLPPTPKDYALRCLKVAKSFGLKEVRLGNVHLLC